MELYSNKKAVQETCSDALKQKVNTIEHGYYDDKYQLEFITKEQKQKYLPIINKGTWSRILAVRNQIEFVVKSNQNTTQIINLGCGMDSLYFHLKDKLPDSSVSVLDLDYSEITKQKIKFIKESKSLLPFFIKSETINNDVNTNVNESNTSVNTDTNNDLFKDPKNFISSDYKILECDLSNTSKLKACLDKSDFKKEELTLIIAECLFCYFDSEDLLSMLKTITSKYDNCVVVYYDLIHPNDYFGKMMIKNLKEFRNITLPSYIECAEEKNQVDRLYKAGFTKCGQCVDLLRYYYDFISKEDKDKVEHLELIDELEEWNLLQKHSCIGFSVKKENDMLFSFLNEYKLK